MSVSCEPIWGWPVLLLLAAGLVALVIVSYRAQADRLPLLSRRRTVLGLKLSAVAVLLFAMFRPAVQFAETSESISQILLVSDSSRSMNTADGLAGATRWQAAREDVQKVEAALAKLGSKVEIRRFEFEQGLRPWMPDAKSGTGEQSAIGQTLLDILKETEGRRTLAVLLFSDGAQRALPPHDFDPLSAAQQFAENQVPVYTSVYGTSSITESVLDLAVEDLLVDPVVFENKAVPLSVRLRAAGAKGRKATVRVLLEGRADFGQQKSGELTQAPATQNARPVWEQTLRTDRESIPVELTFVPQQSGELKLAVEVVAVDGEILTRNNRVETIVSVRKGGVKIAYFDVFRQETKSLNMVNGADKIQLDRQLVWQGKLAGRTRIQDDWFERGKYDVYIIGDVPAERFSPAQLARLKERLDEGASLLMIGGRENFSNGGYAQSVLADYLPVELDLAPGPIEQTQASGKVRLLPTNLGLQQYVMQIDVPEKNRARWLALPPLEGATRLKPKHELVNVWAESDDGSPLLLAATVGRARVAAFAGDTTWLWFLHGHADAHQRFWRQLMLWLARKDADTDQTVWVRAEPRNSLPGGPVTVTFGARQPDGAPMEGVDFQVEVISPTGERLPLPFRKAGQDQAAEFRATQTAGDYWVRVSGVQGGQSLGPASTTRFIVDPRDLELDRPNADYDLLRQIATITGGAPLKSEELAGWAARLADRKLGDLTQVRTVTLWDNWWALLAFVILMSCEWGLRKRWGLA